MLKYYSYAITYLELPNEVSLSFSITSCPNRCGGCHSPHLRKDIGTDISNIFEIIEKYQNHITAVCFLGHGGEDHREEFAGILKEVKETHPKMKIGLYSGFNYMIEEFKGYLDYYKVGEYVEALGGLGSKNTNQVLHTITHI